MERSWENPFDQRILVSTTITIISSAINITFRYAESLFTTEHRTLVPLCSYPHVDILHYFTLDLCLLFTSPTDQNLSLRMFNSRTLFNAGSRSQA